MAFPDLYANLMCSCATDTLRLETNGLDTGCNSNQNELRELTENKTGESEMSRTRSLVPHTLKRSNFVESTSRPFNTKPWIGSTRTGLRNFPSLVVYH